MSRHKKETFKIRKTGREEAYNCHKCGLKISVEKYADKYIKSEYSNRWEHFHLSCLLKDTDSRIKSAKKMLDRYEEMRKALLVHKSDIVMEIL